MATPVTTAPSHEKGQTTPKAETPQRRTGFPFFKLLLFLLIVGGAGAAVYTGKVDKTTIQSALAFLSGHEASAAEEAAKSDHTVAVISRSDPSLPDDVVEVTGAEEEAIGFHIQPVLAQTDPIKLELTGRTAYDDTTITKVRSRFDTRIEKVFATIGQKVKKGDPLVELYSTDLASAKTDYQITFVQWQHDLKLLNLRAKLVKEGGISQQLFVDTQVDEQKSRLAFAIAGEKLTVLEIPREEIDPLIEHLGDDKFDPRKFGEVGNKAKMTLRSKADGYVISREAVPGNFYESTEVLMQIAPLDHLWVWVNVYELDQNKVKPGMALEIQFPFLEKSITGKVDYISPEVSQETRAVRIRAVVPNKDAQLKSQMLVKAMLEIPRIQGQTVVPRLSVVTLNGHEYVFIRAPKKEGSKAKGDTKDNAQALDRFRRVKIQVAQENTDNVVVASGLTAGDEIVTNGSLILAQLYDDQRVVATGLPTQ